MFSLNSFDLTSILDSNLNTAEGFRLSNRLMEYLRALKEICIFHAIAIIVIFFVFGKRGGRVKIRSGARELIRQAVEMELNEFLGKISQLKALDGTSNVVRNGYLPEREIQASKKIGKIF